MFSGVRHFLQAGIRFFKTPGSTNSVGIIPPATEPSASFDLILPSAAPTTNTQSVAVTTTGQIEFRDITTRNNSGTVEARNAANTALAPFRSASVAAGATSGSATISLVPATNNAGIEITGNTGLAYIDFSRTLSDDYNARLILASATDHGLL